MGVLPIALLHLPKSEYPNKEPSLCTSFFDRRRKRFECIFSTANGQRRVYTCFTHPCFSAPTTDKVTLPKAPSKARSCSSNLQRWLHFWRPKDQDSGVHNPHLHRWLEWRDPSVPRKHLHSRYIKTQSKCTSIRFSSTNHCHLLHVPHGGPQVCIVCEEKITMAYYLLPSTSPRHIIDQAPQDYLIQHHLGPK